MSGPNPSVSNVGNSLTAQAILFDKELIPNLKGQTNGFFRLFKKRVQPLNAGINRNFFQYSTLAGNTSQSTDGQVGSPIFVPQNTSTSQVGEWSDYTNFSAFVVASAIDDQVGNSAVEMAYRAGQSLSELYSTFFDSLHNVDANVDATGLISGSSYAITLAAVRTMKEELVAISAMPCEETYYCMAVAPNVMGDLLNASGVNTSLIDYVKYDKTRAAEYEKIAAGDQSTPYTFPTTGVRAYQTPFVTQIPNLSGSSTGFRSYLAGEYAGIGVWLEVPGDTDMNEGDWKTINCSVTTNAASSAYDPTGTIGAWASYRFHQTPTGIPVTGLNTQRLRTIDAVPTIQYA